MLQNFKGEIPLFGHQRDLNRSPIINMSSSGVISRLFLSDHGNTQWLPRKGVAGNRYRLPSCFPCFQFMYTCDLDQSLNYCDESECLLSNIANYSNVLNNAQMAMPESAR